jgi:hypothetical protein
MPVMITLNKVYSVLKPKSCVKVHKAHEHLGLDRPFPLSSILDSNGLDDAILCFAALPVYIEIPKRFALWCAREVQHLMTDERSVNALDVAERYLDGNATLKELSAAIDDADAAVACSRGADYACATAYAATITAVYGGELDVAERYLDGDVTVGKLMTAIDDTYAVDTAANARTAVDYAHAASYTCNRIHAGNRAAAARQKQIVKFMEMLRK